MIQVAPSQHTHHCSLKMPRVSSLPEWNLTSLPRLSKTSLHPRVRSISHRVYKNTPPRPHNKKNPLPWVSTGYCAPSVGLHRVLCPSLSLL